MYKCSSLTLVVNICKYHYVLTNMKINVIVDDYFQNYKSISVEITANWKTEEIAVKQLGSNSSAIDGIELEKGREVRLQLSSTLHILAGLYPQKVEVTKQTSPKKGKKEDTHAPCSSNEKNKKKRTADTDINTNTKKLSPPSKRQKIEQDNSESDEDEHIKSVEEKLKLLKKVKKDRVKEDERKESPEKIPEQSNIKKNCTEMKFSEKKEGMPAPETKWDQYDKLVIYTRKGVCARSKVHVHFYNILFAVLYITDTNKSCVY